ncbi:hypothetical protein J2S05_002324 [Alkalicoccobacillus murimartini]|uniref:DUF4306 domain-containing protein n=1 Tax=Alkalicoccobacillus murimartini TaxID=171685 RepID=A0ABT9YIU1_9BACI|nr:hypothetical protein [Alkalicoccobacillus murimartini]
MRFYLASITLGLSFMLFIFSAFLTWYVGSIVTQRRLGSDGRPLRIEEGLTAIDHFRYAFSNLFFPYPFLMILSCIGILASIIFIIISRRKLLD